MSTTIQPSSSSFPGEAITPLTLRAPGVREVVKERRALEIIDHWKSLLVDHCTTLDRQREAGEAAVAVLCDTIVLSNKSYTADAARVIASFLTTNANDDANDKDEKCCPAKYVTTVDLSDIIASRMEEEGLAVLRTFCNALASSSPHVRHVDLSDNAMGCKGISACAALLLGDAGVGERRSLLQSLSLCNNGLSQDSMREVADILTRPLPLRPTTTTTITASMNGDMNGSPGCIAANLLKLHFYNNMSGDGGCQEWARIIEQCNLSTLVDVRFSGTRATKRGSSIIANALHMLASGAGDGRGNGGGTTSAVTSVQHNNTIKMKKLDLADNTFGLTGGTTLAMALSNMSHLTHLNLRDCCLEDDATIKVCHALWSSSTPLVLLDLSGNDITYKGCEAIAEVVEELSSTSLQVLHLEENEFTSRGIRKLAHALGPCIIDLNLNCNGCGDIGGMELVKAFPTMLKSLRYIKLDGNRFSEGMVQRLYDAFGIYRLEEMVDNDCGDDGNAADDDIESDEDEDDAKQNLNNDDDEDGDGAVGRRGSDSDDDDDHGDDIDVDKLTQAVGNVQLDNFC